MEKENYETNVYNHWLRRQVDILNRLIKLDIFQ